MGRWRICLMLVMFVVQKTVSDSAFWKQLAQQELEQSLNKKPNTNKARNVILFIGDGMGISTVTAARILRGQIQGATGEETVLEFEKFPYIGLAKTYCNDRQTPDSASTATAMMCGEKTNFRCVGLNDQATYKNCSSKYGNEIPCASDWFHADGRSVGIVTTSRITHATPACAYAKTPSRDWEVDGDMVGVTGGCTDIASQLIYNNSHVKVILGGGRQFFLGRNDSDPELNNTNSSKQRLDGIDLTQVWKDDKKKKNFSAKYVWNKSQFDSIDPSSTDYILGLFEASHMHYELDRDNGTNGEPSLAEMTQKAIQVLQKDKNGFFLMVEGARIDHAHHDTNAKRSLHEVLSIEDAVKIANEMTDESDTLIIVTADHSHVFTIAGYPERGNDILGVVSNLGENEVAIDGIPFTTLAYGNGASYDWGNRTNVSAIDTTDKEYVQVAAAPRISETHGGEDVAIYARGPMAHLVDGVHEQHYIAHVMTYAACVAENKRRCDNDHVEDISAASKSGTKIFLYVVCVLVYFQIM